MSCLPDTTIRLRPSALHVDAADEPAAQQLADR